MSAAEAIKEQLRQLSIPARIELIEEVWNEIPDDQLPVPDWHLEEIDRRLEAHQGDPTGGISWEVAKERWENLS